MCKPDPLNRRVAEELREMMSGVGRKVVAAKIGLYHPSRLDHLCRADDDHKPVHLVEFFRIFEACDRPPGAFEVIEERFEVKVIDLQPFTGSRNPSIARASAAIRRAADALDSLVEACSPDSEGGIRVTAREAKNINRTIDQAIASLAAAKVEPNKGE